ncbi:DUF6875 domain-containing protein [Antrihabitans stalactiti]|uniref:DUF6875 domain-containing protein n=1 Tax=Antrihabitans stalactiti TaxID=2584121 RepID=A0A848KGE2_9NOCA|nr:hypothetical protein [Antrihabitans stalactiti]NMN96164.1 hypothetical protein [Antrihabitans stalactiti]
MTTVRDWLADYICRPNVSIGRTGPVCPFVPPAQRAGSLEITIKSAGSAPDKADVTDLVLAALDEFDEIEWNGSNPALRCLVLVIPDLAPTAYGLLDEAHRAVKSIAVRRGMMLGQFHPSCTEPAVRNPDFQVSRAPIPLVAIRHMALHDILFLHEQRDWFEEYRRLFGSYHLHGSEGIDQLFAERYREACAEFGPQH